MIKLVRLDYRLLHGQVVFAWTGHVSAQRIIVVSSPMIKCKKTPRKKCSFVAEVKGKR
jgi:mannose/fructose/N-acetylgalactosamine-specific phosphotransferase system component IIB